MSHWHSILIAVYRITVTKVFHTLQCRYISPEATTRPSPATFYLLIVIPRTGPAVTHNGMDIGHRIVWLVIDGIWLSEVYVNPTNVVHCLPRLVHNSRGKRSTDCTTAFEDLH